MKFSIIVPVYNVEKYLETCVESILSQDYVDYEVILVDDGSPDACPEICERLAASDSRIRVIHKKNGGASSARNAGTEVAKGDYIIYFDSDDCWIDNSGLSAIAAKTEVYHPDIIIFGVEDFNPQTGSRVVSRGNYDENRLNDLPAKALIKSLINSGNFPGAAWMLATKRSFIDNNSLTFKEGVTAEDFDWIAKAFSNASDIKVVDRVIYQYRCVSEGSITSRPRVSSVYGIHNALQNWHKDGDKTLQCMTDYLGWMYLQCLLNYAGLASDEKEAVKHLVKQDSEILKKSSSMKLKAVYAAVATCGIDLVARLIYKIYHSRK